MANLLLKSLSVLIFFSHVNTHSFIEQNEEKKLRETVKWQKKGVQQRFNATKKVPLSLLGLSCQKLFLEPFRALS